MANIFRGDTSTIVVSLKEGSSITDFNGYTVLVTLKRVLDADTIDSRASYKGEQEITTPSTDTVTFELGHNDTLIPAGDYNCNIRMVKTDDKSKILSSANTNIYIDLGATQRI